MFLSGFISIRYDVLWIILYIITKWVINIYHFLLLCFWQVEIHAIVLASVSIHVVERFYVHKNQCFVNDYVYKCEVSANCVTFFVSCFDRDMPWLMFFQKSLWFFPQCDDVFLSVIVVFYLVGGEDLYLELIVIVWKQLKT